MRWYDRHPRAFHTAMCVLIMYVGTTFEPIKPLIDFCLVEGLALLDKFRVSGMPVVALLLGLPVIVAGSLIVQFVRRSRKRRNLEA